MRHLILLPLLFIDVFSCLANGDVPDLFCRRTYEPPIIDGVLDDPCWRDAHGITGFSLLKGEGLAKEQTYGFVLHDHSHLYVAFLCLESRMDSAIAEIFERDGAVWADDCVEVFMDIDHDHVDYYHIIASIGEVRYDEIGRVQPWTWDCNWQVSVARYEDRWTVEIAIPFWCMDVGTPRPGEVWGFNLNREQWRSKEFSGWTATWNFFHEPHHFGHLIFEPES